MSNSLGLEFEKLSSRFIYDRSPILVYWESTRACDLACIHCRAEAAPDRPIGELTGEEAAAFFRAVAEFGGKRLPRLIITGGDPLKRPDLYELIRYARTLGIDVSVTPAATPLFEPHIIRSLQNAGVSSIALSLDGPDAASHDTFRRVPGTFERTMAAVDAADGFGMPLQINTMVTQSTLPLIPRIYDLLKDRSVMRWALFFLIQTGRGKDLGEITPGQCESLLHWVSDLVGSGEAPFAIKTTEAHHLKRVYYQRTRSKVDDMDGFLRSPVGQGLGVRDGNGVVFVSHTGEIFPSGFLPILSGNVRSDRLSEVYRNSALFRSLRDPTQLKGKCGRCAFRLVCGGSRARAYAMTGDALESDPLCQYPTIHYEPMPV
jgi:radical SAM protein